MSNYYDPTSDSSERKPAPAEASSASASATAWNNGYAQTPQVRPLSSSQAPPVASTKQGGEEKIRKMSLTWS
jgi:hypothetical protein